MTDAPAVPALTPQQIDQAHQADLATGRSLADVNVERLAWGRPALQAPTAPAKDVLPAPAAAPVATLAQLRQDKNFLLDLMNNHPGAKAKLEVAARIATGEPAPLPGAMEALEAFKADPENAAKIAAGDTAALARSAELYKAAYPENPVDAAVDQFAPAAQAHEIQIPSLAEAQREAVADGHAQGGDAELLKAVELAKTYATAAELPAADANAIATDISAFEPKWRKFSDREKQTHTTATMAKLTARWGDRTADMIGLARLVMHEASKRQPGLPDFMAATGAGSDFGTIARLAEHGARLAQRKGLTIESLRGQFPDLFKQ